MISAACAGRAGIPAELLGRDVFKPGGNLGPDSQCGRWAPPMYIAAGMTPTAGKVLAQSNTDGGEDSEDEGDDPGC